MKMETPPATGTAAEARWVQGELVRNLMRIQRNTQWASLFLVLLYVGMLWSHVPRPHLVAWAAAATLTAVAGFLVTGRYNRRVLGRGAGEHLAFFREVRWLWPLTGLMSGLTTLLFFDRAPLAEQFVCWLVLASSAMFSINALSPHLATMRAYLDALVAATLLAMAWRIALENGFRVPSYSWWMLALIAMYWAVLRQIGRRMHLALRRNFELQFRNNQLIDSLTRQTQAALEAVEIKNRFLASAAHDIRQPVHALSLYADWLRSEPELVDELAPKIVESTKAVNQLFDSLFDLARLDAGKVKLKVGTVDVAQLARELEVQFRPLAQSKGLEFRVRIVPARTASDPILLRRIVGNLVSNAVKYTKRGGVLLAVRAHGPVPCIEVWDTGIGIPPLYQQEIFREFYKVPVHAGTEEGFGLGLYIVGRLNRILGHTLTLASRPGRGSVFRLALHPCNAEDAAQRAATTLGQLASRP